MIAEMAFLSCLLVEERDAEQLVHGQPCGCACRMPGSNAAVV